jgi:hypothetical protein
VRGRERERVCECVHACTCTRYTVCRFNSWRHGWEDRFSKQSIFSQASVHGASTLCGTGHKPNRCKCKFTAQMQANKAFIPPFQAIAFIVYCLRAYECMPLSIVYLPCMPLSSSVHSQQIKSGRRVASAVRPAVPNSCPFNSLPKPI